MADAPVNHPQCMEFSDNVLETYNLGSFTPEMWASDKLFCRTNNATSGTTDTTMSSSIGQAPTSSLSSRYSSMRTLEMFSK